MKSKRIGEIFTISLILLW